jgi:hypothetical protein
MGEIECVRLSHLPPSTELLVQTINSVYRVVITQGPAVSVQGGPFFPESTSAYINAANADGIQVTVGCICVGWMAEIRTGSRHVITSRVRTISSRQAPNPSTE